MMRKRKDKLPEYAVSDAAAAYIADALMQLALQFEAKHFAQIRRHYQSIVTEPDDGPSQRSANTPAQRLPVNVSQIGETLRREFADNCLASGRRQ
jgi:hypothetical protein